MRRIGCIAVVLALIAVGCRQAEPGPSAPAPKSQPVRPTTTPAAPAQPIATQPVAEVPPPPPDPLHPRVKVTKPSDPQEGWMRIESLASGADEASAAGDWVRPNVIEIETDEVTRLTIDLGDLPLKAKRRIVLRLDRQGFDMASDIGPRVTFERGRAGVWERVRDD